MSDKSLLPELVAASVASVRVVVRGVVVKVVKLAKVVTAVKVSVLRSLAVILVVASSPLLFAEPGQAAGDGRITSYAVDLRLTSDGVVHATETIDVDFGTDRFTGFLRTIPVEVPDGQDIRLYPFDELQVSSPTGAPVQVRTEDNGSTRTIRIGGSGSAAAVTGRQTYVINYAAHAVVNTFDDEQELYWNVVGGAGTMPITAATATVEGPAAIQDVLCFEDLKVGRTPCDRKIRSDGGADYVGDPLAPRESMTVVADFPSGTFPNTPPMMKSAQPASKSASESISMSDGMSVIVLGTLALAVLFGLAVAGAAVVVAVGRRGSAGSAPVGWPADQ